MTIQRNLAHTAASQGHPTGWTAESDWQQTADLLHRYGGLKVIKPLSDH